MACYTAKAETFILSPAGNSIQWQEWGDVYIVYQPSSAETHVFNETTALILKYLKQGSRSIQAVKDWTENAPEVGQGDLATDAFAFATQRPEELGLIESLDESHALQ